MRIGLISDTHIPGGAMEMPLEIARAFEGVELILHSGNIFNPATLDWLERIAPVKAAGSADRDSQSWNDARVAEKQVLELEGHTIGVIHDLAVPGIGGQVYPGTMAAYYPDNASLSTDMEKVFSSKVSIVVFGHTHEVMAEEHNGVLLINPGSPTLPNQLRKLGNVMILELTSGARVAKIVALADYSEEFYREHARQYACVAKEFLQSVYVKSSHPGLKNDCDAWERLKELAPGKRGLDAGCGPRARDVFHLWSQGYDMVGVDALEENIRVAREPHPEIAERVFVADMRQPLPFEDQSFDFVACNAVVQHIEPELVQNVVLPELARCCGPAECCS